MHGPINVKSPKNTSKWQMGFNSVFKGLNLLSICRYEMSLQVIEPPSKEVLEKVWSEFDLNEQRVREAVNLLKDWIQLQPHLPKEIGTFWLRHCQQYHTVHRNRNIK
jgi:hypothetical protein